MYNILEARLREALREFIRRRYNLDTHVATERPPRIELGEMASPVCFELARRLRRAPRQIAQEIVGELGQIEGVQRFEVAGGGYINAFLDRAAFFEAAIGRAGHEGATAPPDAPKNIVEHTNINPNKAAHIGHLRNAALGDTFVRLLRHTGHRVEVQNYIDNTGVQVADVVVGFQQLEKSSPAAVRARADQPRFDYFCWDLYVRVTQFFEEDPSRPALRAETLKAIEEHQGAASEIAEVVSTAIVRCHLRTMERLGVEYDLLPRESEILGLQFWDAAFRLLRERGAIRRATAGKNAGCWVMHVAAAGAAEQASEEAADEEDAKIIVRSNGTVTYVGKDIAYQLWKFGLLGRDFRYAPFHTHPSGHTVWATCTNGGVPNAPAFGKGEQVYNVIDTRQAYLQNVVVMGLRALGFGAQADRSIHFSYEVVALTPRCAGEMGYTLSAEEAQRSYVEVSGRKGLGVKADDLLDKLEAAARAEVDQRHAQAPESERAAISHDIAIGALRYFLLKYTRTTVIAFDFKDALSFEGEAGPYCQYAAVRARNILRKWAEQEEQSLGKAEGTSTDSEERERRRALPSVNRFLAAPSGNDLWELILLAGSLGTAVEAAVAAQEPAFVAKFVFQLAQAFNNFYHQHHVLSEEDEQKRAFLLLLTRLVERQLVSALQLLGIEAPQKM
ncbi:MAG TPA: arginine--tRNA ligase [Candidatus Acidoferrales bacterium]|nr:arginine--tRNA ligase [Candidatus Acidoferrales bacterium]